MRSWASLFIALAFVFIGTLVIGQGSEAALLDESIVLYLPFDEGAGDTTADLSQHAHEANLVNGPEWVDGQFGKALQFTGTNYVQVPINDILQLTEIFTAEFWVKRDADQLAAWNYMVAAGSLKWAAIYNTDQSVYCYSDAGGWGQRAKTTEPLTEEWTHVALTYDIDEGVHYYFNAEEAAVGAGSAEIAPIDGSIMVGARHPGQEFFSGIIDDVILYNRVLPPDEILRDMSGGLQAVSPSGKLATVWGALKR